VKCAFKHTNIIAKNWKNLSRFYQEAFGCEPVAPIRNLEGDWLEKGTAVKKAQLQGEHLRLPGVGDNGPTLEIFQYSENLEKPEAKANRCGFGHIAFEVEDVVSAVSEVIAFGGSAHGQIVEKEVPGAGLLEFTYVEDPEGNLIELQSWS
jgi:catechol 2,3-dioxygenase-like lactoylglutathione lyase family enzyme